MPLQPCRRHGKKRKEDEPDAVIGRKDPPTLHRSPCSVGTVDHRGTPMSLDMASVLEGMEAAQLQSSQVRQWCGCVVLTLDTVSVTFSEIKWRGKLPSIFITFCGNFG